MRSTRKREPCARSAALGLRQRAQRAAAAGGRVDDQGDVALHRGERYDGRDAGPEPGRALVMLRRRAPPRHALAVLACSARWRSLLLGGCGSSERRRRRGTQAQTRRPRAGRPVPDGRRARAARASSTSKPKLQLDPSKTWTGRSRPTAARSRSALDVGRAPKTAASFASLAKKGFYDDLTFHRIAQGFVIQGGDPLGTGTGGPGYTIVETPPRGLHYTHGVVAMAKAATEPVRRLRQPVLRRHRPGRRAAARIRARRQSRGGPRRRRHDRRCRRCRPDAPSDGPPAAPVVIESADAQLAPNGPRTARPVAAAGSVRRREALGPVVARVVDRLRDGPRVRQRRPPAGAAAGAAARAACSGRASPPRPPGRGSRACADGCAGPSVRRRS